jgi:hypothetical protein
MILCPRCNAENWDLTRECACGQRIGAAVERRPLRQAELSVALEGRPKQLDALAVGRAQCVAREYRNLVLFFAGQLLLGAMHVAGSHIENGVVREAVGAVVLWGALGSALGQFYFTYQTSRAMGSSAPWAWSLGMFVPCANIVTLLLLSSRATTLCRAAGIPVGLLGPRPTNEERRSRRGAA